MNTKSQHVLKQWIKETESNGQCVKFGFFSKGNFYDCGTIIDWGMSDYRSIEIIEVTSEYLLYYDDGEECKYYADSFPVDEFGQNATFRNPPSCYWFYWDKNESDEQCLPSSSEEILEDPDLFTDWANSKYPNSFLLVGEYIDSEISEWFWDCYTYNPKLSEAEVLGIMREYVEAGGVGVTPISLSFLIIYYQFPTYGTSKK